MAIPVCARGVDSIMLSISNNAINTAIAEMQEEVTPAIAAMKEEITSAIAGMREEVSMLAIDRRETLVFRAGAKKTQESSA